VPTRSRTVLLPHEHGAYGEVLFPLASALVLGQTNQAVWGLTLAAIAGFLAHEGFVVLLGSRGSRARRESNAPARRSVIVFGALAVIGAVLAWPALTPDVARGFALAATLSAAALAVAWLGREHSLGGELLAALALTSWCVPVALAGAVPVNTAMTAWMIWCGVYALATVVVHSVIAGAIQRSPLTARRLRTIGWSIVALSVATLLLIWSVFR